uniref:transcription factor PAR1-like n=1 Tax=Erigeron canadensis TaxID=72917 RepID=UPI001CB8FBC1|nr:transcription factor PAR1-like [Erigeron canadensis]
MKRSLSTSHLRRSSVACSTTLPSCCIFSTLIRLWYRMVTMESYNGELKKVKSSLKTGRKTRRNNTTVVRKVEKLQKLVPGGRGLNAARLFDHTANYIMHLKLQVDMLQALSDHVYRS